MASINLLPAELRRDLPVAWSKFGIKLFLLGFFTLFLLCILVFYFIIFNHKLKIARIEENLMTIQPNKQQALELEKKIESLNNQITVLKSLEERQTFWHKFLWDLNDRVPLDLWLLGFAGDSGGMIKITGQSLNFNSIGVFLNQLSQSPFLTGVELLKVEGVFLSAQLIYNFEFQAKLVKDVENSAS